MRKLIKSNPALLDFGETDLSTSKSSSKNVVSNKGFNILLPRLYEEDKECLAIKQSSILKIKTTAESKTTIFEVLFKIFTSLSLTLFGSELGLIFTFDFPNIFTIKGIFEYLIIPFLLLLFGMLSLFSFLNNKGKDKDICRVLDDELFILLEDKNDEK